MTKDKKSDTARITEFKDKFKSDGEHLVKNVFPQKIIELEDYFQTLSQSKVSDVNCDLNIPVPDPILFYNGEEFQQYFVTNTDYSIPRKQKHPPGKKRKLDALNSIVGDNDVPGSKVMVLPNGPVPCNMKIMEIAEKIKPYTRDLIDHSNTLKMWIAFLIPKIEDGNNFGVSIQEETLSEARTVESEAAAYLDQISRYFISRAKLVSKVAKYPHIDDYRQSIRELDEKEFVSLRLTCCELRNHYASLHDLIIKNIDKIKKPRSANAESLY